MTNKTTVKTWRERIGAGPKFPLHAPTDVERAMEAEISELRARVDELQTRVPTSTAAQDVLAERRRQVDAEGWAPEHDDHYVNEELRKAASAYLTAWTPYLIPNCWPWSAVWWKPGTDRRNLEKAGALIIAEIERLDRAEEGGAS